MDQVSQTTLIFVEAHVKHQIPVAQLPHLILVWGWDVRVTSCAFQQLCTGSCILFEWALKKILTLTNNLTCCWAIEIYS